MCAAVTSVVAQTRSGSEILLRVRVTDAAYTGYYPEAACGNADDCIPIYHWFRYEARVLKVVRGEYPKKTVVFGNLQDSAFARRPHDWYVLLVPCGENAMRVEYCVKDSAFAGERAQLKQLIGAKHGA